MDPDVNYFRDAYHSSLRDLQDNDELNSYFTIEQFNSDLLHDFNPKKALIIIALNIRSFYKHIDQFTAMLTDLKYKPDIIVLTETWLTRSNKETASLDGYKVFHTVRSETRGGGVSLFCRSDLSFEVMGDISVCNNFVESVGVRIKLNNVCLFIIGIYRPPSGAVDELTDWLGEAINSAGSSGSNRICLLGDFNVNLLNIESVQVCRFVNVLQAYNLIPTIRDPTRYPPNLNLEQPSLLDHVWVNFFNFSASGILDFDITDHSPIYIIVDRPIPDNNKVKLNFRDQSKTNLDAFCLDLENVHWSEDNYNNINDKFSYFTDTINYLYRKNCKMKVKYISEKRLSKPWINNDVLSAIRAKSNYFSLYKRGLISKEQNNYQKNKLNSVIRRAKRAYYHEYFDNFKSNMKKYWEGVRSLIGRGGDRRRVIESVNVDGNIVSDSHIIASSFNSYFSNTAYVLRDSLPAADLVPVTQLIDPMPNSFYFYPVTVNECVNIISKLKNTSYGLNCISARILKIISNYIATKLTDLINESFQTGIFPDVFKIASICPVYKRGDPLEISNYRPIAILPLFSKVIEKCMAVRMTKFLSRFGVLSPNQFGFQKGISTCDAIISLMDLLYEGLNRKNHNVVLFLDLCKAYDTVDHDILLRKLYCYGFRGNIWQWFKSYLCDRRQFVRIGSSESSSNVINISVPQGSILGCYLFLLYINDLPQASNILKPFLFADDTTLVHSGHNFDNLVSEFNSELQNINRWLIRNRLSLNVNKSVALIVSNRILNSDNCCKLKLGASVINYSTETKYLGLTIDRGLSFSGHIREISGKISRNIGIMYRISYYVPKHTLLNLYYTFIYPYLIYCNIIWGGAATTHLNDLLLLQKKVVRIITDSEYHAHSDPLFASTGILKIADIHRYLCCIYAFNHYDKFSTNQHQYSTRHRDIYLRPDYHRLSMTQNSLSYKIPSIFNGIPMEIKSLIKLKPFKKNLKSYLVSCYNL